ncbi:MAG: hypothetical protein EZS28_030835 [Streblomastix strix]|uniref:non-specific serine/threonine protein kinase n=1 Tax=Streblomastix strix TaxID=222440 RepID=A0A5J4UT87_9EUKA|nr:MAG: hypothetical protein EZS28_030835 [Streblomastix strix]
MNGHIKTHDSNQQMLYHKTADLLPHIQLDIDSGYKSKDGQLLECPFCNTQCEMLDFHVKIRHKDFHPLFKHLLQYQQQFQDEIQEQERKGLLIRKKNDDLSDEYITKEKQEQMDSDEEAQRLEDIEFQKAAEEEELRQFEEYRQEKQREMLKRQDSLSYKQMILQNARREKVEMNERLQLLRQDCKEEQERFRRLFEGIPMDGEQNEDIEQRRRNELQVKIEAKQQRQQKIDQRMKERQQLQKKLAQNANQQAASSTIPQFSFSSDIPFNMDWKKSDFQELEVCGKYGLDNVHHIIEKRTQNHAVWKKMTYETEHDVELVNREVRKLREIYQIVFQSVSAQRDSSKFIHVVKPLGFFVDEEEHKAYLVMEYFENGDMRKYMDTMKRQRVSIRPKKVYEMIGSIANSLEQLHINGIIHCDLRPECILLTDEFEVKITNFTYSRQIHVGREFTTDLRATSLYQSPEFLRSKNIGKGINQKNEDNMKDDAEKLILMAAADIWSFGVIIYELLAHIHPFVDIKTEGYVQADVFIHRVVAEEPEELPKFYPKILRNLVMQMLSKDPTQRKSAKEIHDFAEVAAKLENE